jgi:hypothetical protein
MTPFELASYNSHRRWFIILLASLGWMIGLVLSFDIGSDYQASFSTGQASWYFLAWEVSEILLVAGVFAVFTARTSASLEVGWVIFVFLAVAPGSGLLAPEIAASGKFLKIGTWVLVAILVGLAVFDWNKIPINSDVRMRSKKGRV